MLLKVAVIARVALVSVTVQLAPDELSQPFHPVNTELAPVEAFKVIRTPLLKVAVHVLPQLMPTIIVWGTLGIATNVMLEASLSYLGIGVQPPTPSWGGMIQQAQSFYRSAPWMVLFPGLAIMLTVFAFNLLGDGLRDALDPTQRGKL